MFRILWHGKFREPMQENTNCITSSRFHGKKKSTTSFGWRNSGYFFLNAITINVDRIEDPASDMDVAPIAQDDAVYNYATNFTKLGLLRKVAVNATRYGDGNRMLRHWKYAMLVYHQGHKIKYRLESFLLLA